MQSVPESFGSVKEGCRSLKKNKRLGQSKHIYITVMSMFCVFFFPSSMGRMLSEATLCSVSKNTILIRVCIVMEKTIVMENAHLLDYI